MFSSMTKRSLLAPSHGIESHMTRPTTTVSASLTIRNDTSSPLASSITVTMSTGDYHDKAVFLAAQLAFFCGCCKDLSASGRLPALPLAHYLAAATPNVGSMAFLSRLADELFGLVEADVAVGNRRVLWQLEPQQRNLIFDALAAFQHLKEESLRRQREAKRSPEWATGTLLSKRDYAGLNEAFLAAELPKAPAST